ncbi:MAG: YdeI/OmpD-associated family protein [Caulobacter sp.]|jgi:hypothetical protein|nr:YdeI/OmpD-associated family protein [Caulobacter sp.]
MAGSPPCARAFQTILVSGPGGAVLAPLPFDPADIWGLRLVYHLAGKLNGMDWRGVPEEIRGDWALRLGPAWRRDCGLGAGDRVDVILALEGPQRAGLAQDIQAALEARPEASGFFDEIAQFYRTAYVKWIEATRRSPEKRAERIAMVVELLADRQKQRPAKPD